MFGTIPRLWGAQEIQRDQGTRFEIGAMTLDVLRNEREWLLNWMRDPDPLLRRASIEAVDELLMPDATGGARRIHADNELDLLKLTAVMADRPIVVRPEARLVVPSGDRVTVLVTCPLWVQIALGDNPPVLDLPSCRPSDTWFGSSTTQGELCYAGRTWAKTCAEDLGHWPNRAIVTVEIENRAADAMEIESIRVPAPNLSVYIDDTHRLWSPSILFRREDSGTTGSIEIRSGAPHEGLELVGNARQVLSGRQIRRALNRLFH